MSFVRVSRIACAVLFAAAVAIAAPHAYADTLLSLTGPSWTGHGLGEGNGQQAVAASFTTTVDLTNTSFIANIGWDGYNSPQTVSYWLTDQIGSGTTSANVLASGTFVGVSGNDTVFSGIDLTAGTYYVTLSVIGAFNDTGWTFTPTPAITHVDGVTYGTTYEAAQQSGTFGPGFNLQQGGDPVLFELDGTAPAPTGTPEPASLMLLGSGVLFLFRKRRA